MRRLEGPLDFAHVPEWLEQSREWVAAGTALNLELGAVTRCDSAGLSLLLELARRARAASAELKLLNAPPQMRELLDFYRLNELFTLA
ncbi:MAG: STAS domain-containing protein [Nevskiales bacterium]